MRPNIECPSLVTDEVRMPLRHAAVVDGLVLAGVVALLHGHRAAISRAEQVARLEQARLQPALAQDVERMLARRADQLAADVQMPDATRADKQFLDQLPAAGVIRLVLRLAPHFVAFAQLLYWLRDELANVECLGASGRCANVRGRSWRGCSRNGGDSSRLGLLTRAPQRRVRHGRDE